MRDRNTNTASANARGLTWKSWLAMGVLGVMMVVLLLGLGFWFSGRQGGEAVLVRLENTTDFQVKSQEKLLGMNIVRIASRQQPQEFVVISPVSESLLSATYGKTPDKAWVNQLANRFAERISDDATAEGRPLSVDVRQIDSKFKGMTQWQGHELPYWELAVEFRLNRDTMSRYYQVGVLRDIPAEGVRLGKNKEVVLVSYAPDGVYRQERMSGLLNALGFSSRKL